MRQDRFNPAQNRRTAFPAPDEAGRLRFATFRSSAMPRDIASGIGNRLCCLLCVALATTFLVIAAGCQHLQKPQPVELPARHSVRLDQLLVLSDFQIPRHHPLISELDQLRSRVRDELQLPEQRDSVVVYLFSDESSYRRYLESTWPGLPWRRAYFVGSPRELSVYTFWGDRIQQDLRHEYTHGILHSCLLHVPLWLDEGLAEYFEVAAAERAPVNREYVHNLTLGVTNGWNPDLSRLEAMTEFSQMQRSDYQEAWGWVHYMLHSSVETRQVLLDYLAELRHSDRPGPLRDRLSESVPAYTDRLVSWLATLQTGPHFVSGNPRGRPLHSVSVQPSDERP